MKDSESEPLELSDIENSEIPPWDTDYRYFLRPQFAKFAREHIWSEDLWDLFIRYRAREIHFHDLNEEDLLREASYLDLENEDLLRRMKINAEWEPNIPSDDTVIRRFLTFDRFVDLIDNGGFWMSNISKFSDQFEATFPDPSVRSTQQFVDAASDMSPNEDQVTYGTKKQRERDNHTYANCWRFGTSESSIFWDAYLGDEDGLAIQTTVGDLRDHIYREIWDGYINEIISNGSVAGINQFSKVLIGEVEYLDYDSEPISNSPLSPSRFFHKRNAFEDEQEFRLVLRPPPQSRTDNLPEPKDGVILEADLGSLINKVIISPNSSERFINIAEAAIEDELNIPVEKSSLFQDPNMVDLPEYDSSG